MSKLFPYQEDQILDNTRRTQTNSHDTEKAHNSINIQQIGRLFNTPLVESREAAGSSPCDACGNRARECLTVSLQFFKSQGDK